MEETQLRYMNLPISVEFLMTHANNTPLLILPHTVAMELMSVRPVLLQLLMQMLLKLVMLCQIIQITSLVSMGQ